MKRKLFLWLPLLCVAAVVGAWGLAAPADAPAKVKTVAVLSVASYNELLADVGLIGKLTDNPDLPKGLEVLLNLVTRSRGLAGMDKSRPGGLVVQTDGQTLRGYGFVPVSDLDALLEVLEPAVGKPAEAGDGLLRIKGKGGGKPVFIREGHGWAFFADHKEWLATVPDDPASLLDGLGERYDLAVRFYAANVPEKHRRQLIAQIKEGAAREAKRRAHESEEQFALRSKIEDEMLQSVLTLIDDVEQITLGFSLDHEAQNASAELSVIARRGSQTAAAVAKLRQNRSRFAGFMVPEAALAANWSGQMPERKVAVLSAVVDAMRAQAMQDIERQKKPEAERELAKEVVGTVLDALKATVEKGRADGGVAVLLEPEAATIVAGGVLVGAPSLEEAARKVVEAAKAEHPEIGDWVRFDAEHYKSVEFHTLSIPIPPDAEDREKVVALIGEKLEVVVGLAPEAVYLAAGREPLKQLKQAIDSSAELAGAAVEPLRCALDLGTLARFVAAVGKPREQAQAARVAKILADTPTQDHITLVARMIPRGVCYRLEVEPGVLRMLGRLATAPHED